MKYHIEITLPTVPYDHDITGLAGYLQMIGSELTKLDTEILINDYDFTSKVSIFRDMRRPSFTNRNTHSYNLSSGEGSYSSPKSRDMKQTNPDTVAYGGGGTGFKVK